MPDATFDVIDVSGWEIVDEETGGAEEKVWLRSPATGDHWLFKPVTVKDGRTYGDDWAEKAAGELAVIFGIPCARIELAQRADCTGAISLSLKPHGYELQEGAIVLEAMNARGYISGHPSGRPGHNLSNIQWALSGLGQPPAAQLPASFTAFDVFCGYLIFDAWIANADRHDQNWAVLRHQTDPTLDRLCGAYDQANCLGYNITTIERDACLQLDGRNLQRWVSRGYARRFEHRPGSPRRTLVDLAADAVAAVAPEVKDYWMSRLTQITASAWVDVLASIGKMSDPHRSFAGRVLDINRKRLLDACR